MRWDLPTTLTMMPVAQVTFTTPALSVFGIGHSGLVFDFKNTKHLVLYGRNIVESLMVKESKAFMAALAEV